MVSPLADRIRPKTLKKFVGQSHLVGVNKPIRLAIEKGRLHSMVFWGPPGSGKTTLARIIASEIKAEFHNLSAVSASKDDVREIVEGVRESYRQPKLDSESEFGSAVGARSVLFLDEIHRFNKAQQDFLLPFVEDGTITLIGATTENPSFEVIGPLLSRCQVFVLEPLSEVELAQIIRRGARKLGVRLYKKAKEFLIDFSNGDARQALNLLEATCNLYGSSSKAKGGKYTVTVGDLNDALQSKFLRYDKKGEEHYNVISAFIKSLRASNVDAAIYYLARMVEAGEDPLFIARRLVIFASEDIGMAQPTALVVANEVFKACEVIGYPECAINLAHGVAYLASAKKDRSAYDALKAAQSDVKKYGNLRVPLSLRNAPTKLMKELGFGKGYKAYTDKDLLPEKLLGKKYYKD